RTVPFHRFAGSLQHVLALEGALPPEGQGPSEVIVHQWNGDHGLVAMRTKALARSDLEAVPATLRPAWEYGATVLGPVLTGFAEWVHQRANAIEAPTVWCMMREGEFLADLINRAGDYLSSKVQA